MKATYGFHAKMTARPGKGDELVKNLFSVADVLGANENCVVFLVGRSASNSDVVYVTEGWTTKDAHAENFASEQAKASVARNAPLLSDEAQYQDEVPIGGHARR